eukprot:3494765-Pyramimonas_sp.AAC.1
MPPVSPSVAWMRGSGAATTGLESAAPTSSSGANLPMSTPGAAEDARSPRRYNNNLEVSLFVAGHYYYYIYFNNN